MMKKYLLPLFLFLSFSTAFAASFEEGREAYLAKDYAKALSILKPMAEKGHAKAQVTLGIMYDFGHGVEKDPAIAVDWYEKAAAQGNSAVQHDLGVKYFKGQGIPQDYDKAAAWWRMAADNGVAESQYNLGLMYARGLGFDKDSPKAVNWYYKAAAQGHPHAQYSLGVMYSFGQGVPQDYTKGLSYFQDAAEQDIAQAQYNLAVLLENGRGTDVDLVGAKKWYQRASDAGIEQATQRLASFDDSRTNPPTSSQANNETATKTATVATNNTGEEMKVAIAEAPSAKPTEPASTIPADIVTNPEPVPAPAKMEKLTIPETEITKNNSAPSKALPENHQVISGTVIENASDKHKETKPVQVAKTAKAPVKKPTPKPASKPAMSSSQTYDESWIRSQNPQHYALQMIAFSKEDNARRYMENLDLVGEKAIYKSSMHGRTIYKVVYGNFVDHRASLKGRRALPPKYRDAKPFPRSFEFIQNDIKQ